MQSTKFDISKLRGRLGKMRDWMISHNMPPMLLFVVMGIASTIWFLVRVIPKPSRASYPCMQVAAPFMSGFIAYILAVAGLTAISRKFRKKINVRFGAVTLLLTGVIVAFAITPSSNTQQIAIAPSKLGPDDGPNQPIGEAKGIFPGRVVWIWNPDATNEKFEHGDFATYNWYFSAQNNNPKVIAKMFSDGILKLTGEKNTTKAWEAIFRLFNSNKHNEKRGYKAGEKIFIKINQGQSRWVLEQKDKDNGFYLPRTLEPGQEKRITNFVPTEQGPYVVIEVLRELINGLGIPQENISIGDPMCPIWGHNYEVWSKEFPNVKYLDKNTTNFGRTLVKVSEKPLLFTSDGKVEDKLYDVIEQADYLINMTTLKSHMSAGVSLTAKSHFGDIGTATANHLHYSHPAAGRGGKYSNSGYGKYRVFVDLMGSKYLGQNTMFWFVEGLFGGGASEIKGPVKYFMPPFNNDWCNSMFMSLDPVAIESVGFDFLRTEWNGERKHDAVNNESEFQPSVNGVDDYMHQAADHSKWPQGIIYDPDRTGKPIPVLGVHEHWNNSTDKQYTRNLGTGKGIELVSIPDSLVKSKKK
jgi:hypothetical protein